MAMTAGKKTNKDVVEVLKILKRVRAKSEDDLKFARIYEPGEEGRFKGSAKLQLIAMKSATADLNAIVETKKKDEVKPNLHGMKNDELDILAETLGLDVSKMKRSEKIAAIKDAY